MAQNTPRIYDSEYHSKGKAMRKIPPKIPPPPKETKAIRPLYDEHGAEGYYAAFGANYRNPHEAIIHRCLAQATTQWQLNTESMLDLACGSGEVTLFFKAHGTRQITGIDPFTGEAYLQRTRQTALPHTFEDIENGALVGQSFGVIVCSFALHLAEASRLPTLCYQLAQVSSSLIVLTPHKRPHISPTWGWHMHDEYLIERVRTRLYQRR